MKLSWQPETQAGEFEGRTAEEAVRFARQALGDDAAVRCWKTRRGGIAGFFARETFVAATAPPAGAVNRVKVTRAASPRGTSDRVPAASSPAAAPVTPAPGVRKPPEPPNASQLVEWPEDEVVLGSDPVPDDAFRKVLAEAEAAVHAAPVFASSGRRASTGCPDDASAEGPIFAPLADRPEWIEDLGRRLADIGVPQSFLPVEEESTFDGLARALAKLPRARPLPHVGGSVIAVVGARRDASTTAGSVSSTLGLESSDLIVVEPNDASRQRLARRRASKKTTVVVVEASLRSRALPAVARWIEKVKPEQVLGAVPAAAKRADVEHWAGQIGRIDALALLGLADTMTPGELMGEVPIAYIDEAEASILGWALLLLSTIEGRAQ